MTTITPELLAEIKAKAESAESVSKGPWEQDRERMLDTPDRHHEYVVIDGDGHVICDTFNSGGGLIEDDRDGEGGRAWNEASRRRTAHIARMDPTTALALVAALEEAQRERDAAVKAHNECTEWLKESEAARDAALAEHDVLRAENEKLRAALAALVRLNDDYSPFGGELLRDRIDAMWDHARAALKETTHAD